MDGYELCVLYVKIVVTVPADLFAYCILIKEFFGTNRSTNISG
jgi:hypothetical protein